MKHQFRMTEGQWIDFLEISKSRFGTDIDDFSSPEPELEINSMDSMKESKVESDITNYDLTPALLSVIWVRREIRQIDE